MARQAEGQEASSGEARVHYGGNQKARGGRFGKGSAPSNVVVQPGSGAQGKREVEIVY